MIHFDEMTCILYLEGQLESGRVREMAVHMDQCGECRVLLQALESESLALAAALAEENELLPSRLRLASRETIASWVWAACFSLFAACAAWLWLDTLRPVVEQASNAGFGGTEVISWLLFNGAFWEGWSELIRGVEIATLTLLVALATGLLRRRVRRPAIVSASMMVLAVVFALPQPASAAEVRRGESVVISAGETIHNDLIVAAPSVRIDGVVEGDVIAFARTLTVSGRVTGDVIAFTGEIRVDGVVEGNVRVLSNIATLEGMVQKNVSGIVNSLDITSKAHIAGGLVMIAGQATLDGRVARDFMGIAGRTYLDGAVGGQLWLRGRSLTVGSTAEVGGPAAFHGSRKPIVAAQAKFASPLRVEMAQETYRFRMSAARIAIHELFSYAAALLLGFILITVLPGFFRAVLSEARSIAVPIGVGTLAIIIGAFVIVAAILLMLVGVGAGVAGVFLYAPVLYAAQVFVGSWLGEKILRPAGSATAELMSRLALGLLVLHLAGLIPVLGWLVWLTVLLWGTGAILMGFYRMSRIEQLQFSA